MIKLYSLALDNHRACFGQLQFENDSKNQHSCSSAVFYGTCQSTVHSVTVYYSPTSVDLTRGETEPLLAATGSELLLSRETIIVRRDSCANPPPIYQRPEPVQVPILFKAIGNAPIMKQNLYKINALNQFRAVIRFLRKQLGYKSQDSLFTYINLAFAPAPDDTVLNLSKSFASDGMLIVNYSTTAAWG
ncbi:APG12-domain-containing protein [Daedalea quercina L-15889]|uniref:Ubiquitin-like protein ATG12 n=1 Tax=Daedalea quercina L-15889 TaxID=1314783 RepID=A0A165QKR5_9APHY|nr:APG12-domain-containing protein [Daedalea quercina L-15889]